MGGTFDPIHIGHLLMARHALENLELDNVVFIPSGTPPHKDEKAKPLDRLTMVEIALEGERFFTLIRWRLKDQALLIHWIH